SRSPRARSGSGLFPFHPYPVPQVHGPQRPRRQLLQEVRLHAQLRGGELMPIRRAFILVALLAGVAHAQQMPDPRQMSGIPRPDPQVAEGTVTVKVVLGDLTKLAPAGTLVHLVAIKSDGTIAKLTRPLADDGRAEFTDLARDGGTAYYAFCLL